MTNDQIMAFVAVKPDGTVDPVTSARNAIKAGASREEAVMVFKAANIVGNPEGMTGVSAEPPLPWRAAWEKIKAEPSQKYIQSPASEKDLSVETDIIDFDNIKMTPLYSPEWYAAEQPRDMPKDYIHNVPQRQPGTKYSAEWYNAEQPRDMPSDYVHNVPYPEQTGFTRESSIAPIRATEVMGQTPTYAMTPEMGERIDFKEGEQVTIPNPYSMQGSSMESRFAPGQPSEVGGVPPVYGQTGASLMETGERVDFTNEPAQVHVVGPRGRGFSRAEPTVISPSPEFYQQQSKMPPPDMSGQTPVAYGQSMAVPPPDLSGQTPAPPMPADFASDFYSQQTAALPPEAQHGPYGMTQKPPTGELHGPYGETSASLAGQTMRPAADLLKDDTVEMYDKMLREGQSLQAATQKAPASNEAPRSFYASKDQQRKNREELMEKLSKILNPTPTYDFVNRNENIGIQRYKAYNDPKKRAAMAKQLAVKKALAERDGPPSEEAMLSAKTGAPMRGAIDVPSNKQSLQKPATLDQAKQPPVGGQTMKQIQDQGQKEGLKSYKDREAEYLKSIGMTAQEKQMYANADPKWKKEGYKAVRVDQGDSPKEAGKKITDDVISQMAGVGGAEWEGFIPTIQNAIRQLENIAEGRDPYDAARARVAGSSRRSLAGTEYAAKTQAAQDVRSRTSKSMSQGTNAALESGQATAKLKDQRSAKEESAAVKLFDGMPMDSLLRWGKDPKNKTRMEKNPRIGAAYMAAIKRARNLETKSQASANKKTKDAKDKLDKEQKRKAQQDSAVTKFGEAASKAKSSFEGNYKAAMTRISKNQAEGGRKRGGAKEEMAYKNTAKEWSKRYRNIQEKYDLLYNKAVPKDSARAESVKNKEIRKLRKLGEELIRDINGYKG